MNDHLFGKELFIRFTASAFRKLLSVYVFSYFPLGFEGRICYLIVSVPDHCLSFYFKLVRVILNRVSLDDTDSRLSMVLPAKYIDMVLRSLHDDVGHPGRDEPCL